MLRRAADLLALGADPNIAWSRPPDLPPGTVLIAGPLGLCFLPAFLCVGIVPLVVGLAGDVLQFGLV
ncbi:alanine rich membrane protein [Mycobacterium tuberculosis]|nr:alanine rich membrane protein [Mycobacterium tuberculosis]